MIKLRSFAAFIAFLFLMQISYSQMVYSTKNKKAIKYFDQAMEYFQSKSMESCEASLMKAIKEDDQFVEAHLLLAQISDEQKKYDKAIDSYKNVLDIDPDFFPNVYYNVADDEFQLARYDDAQKHLKQYFTYDKLQPQTKRKAAFLLKCCVFAADAVKHPVPFTPENMGDSINSENSEYSPALTLDEQTMIETRLRPRDQNTLTGRDMEEDFYVSNKNSDGTWSKMKPVGPPLNSHGNEGCPSLTADGKTMYFAICNRSDGLGSCDIYTADRKGKSWTVPVNLGIRVNSSAWDSQPSISPDGNTLYFTSSRSGSKGYSDIWKTSKGTDGEWTTPVRLIDSINTEGSEQTPFIHPDGKTLYFTSNGHPGMGNFDIFYSHMDDNGNWPAAKNIGYPINSSDADGFLFVNAQGNKAYFASDKFGGKGGMDIYSFDLYEEARPTAVTYMKGTVYDSKTKKRLDAKFEMIDLSNSVTAVQSVSDPVTGEFMVSLPADKNYALNVSREGYLFYSENFELKGNHTQLKPYVKDVYLQPIEAGSIVILKNIFFDFDKFDLKPESQVELNRLFDLLQKNKAMKIEIGGHTDNKGTAEYNQKLSESRARAVYDYLVNKGIDKNRLSYKGYGLTKPIDTNDTEEGRANNRRTEFKVVSN
jgi:outer membrane protein OmpA-like peptidoglycan-associated protein/tetratricopeptide (TPR) repeat protein